MIRVVSWWEDEATTFFVSPLRDFLRANDGSLDVLDAVRASLRSGEAEAVGGGAAPLAWIRAQRVQGGAR